MDNPRKVLNNYLSLFPNERNCLVKFSNFLDSSSNYFNRKNSLGHIVANALVINSNNQVLMIYHKFLKMYIQPGGHVEAIDNSMIEATKRELF